MRSFKAKEIVKALSKRGAVLVVQKGSHAKYRFENCVSTVPMHNGDVPKGTVAAIIKDFEPVFGKGWLK